MKNRITNISHLMRRSLNTINYKLMDHGERVSYLLLKMFEADQCYSQEQLIKIAYMGLFHDIGAYQTEQSNSLLDKTRAFTFETANPIPHSVHGYLFLNEYPFFSEFCDALLYHHFTYDKLMATECVNKKLAARLFLADRWDLMLTNGLVRNLDDALKRLDNAVFSRQEVEHLYKLEKQDQVLSKCISGDHLDEYLVYLDKQNHVGEHIDSLIHMLPHAIDFRSEYTVTHTTATVEITMILADLFNLSDEEKKDIYLGSLLHDIGKIAISTVILEKPSKLTAEEYRIMKDHVLLTEYILNGCVSKEVARIAVRHHEKLNGQGYPYNLTAPDLTLSQRIVAVADVMSALMGVRSYKSSFSEDKVRAIMTQSAENGELCPNVIDVALKHYPYISKTISKVTNEAFERYDSIQQQANTFINLFPSSNPSPI